MFLMIRLPKKIKLMVNNLPSGLPSDIESIYLFSDLDNMFYIVVSFVKCTIYRLIITF